jgi:hypothetical protein
VERGCAHSQTPEFSSGTAMVALIAAHSKHTRLLKTFETIRTAPPGPKREPSVPLQRQKRLGEMELNGFKVSYLAGLPIKELAEKYNINRDTVLQHAKRLGLTKRSPKLSPGDIEEAALSLRRRFVACSRCTEVWTCAAHRRQVSPGFRIRVTAKEGTLNNWSSPRLTIDPLW